MNTLSSQKTRRQFLTIGSSGFATLAAMNVLWQQPSIIVTNQKLYHALTKDRWDLKSRFANIHVSLAPNQDGTFTLQLIGAQKDIPHTGDEGAFDATPRISTPADLHIGVAVNFTNFLNELLRDNHIFDIDIQNSVGIGKPTTVNGKQTKGRFTQRMTAQFRIRNTAGQGRVLHVVRVGSMHTKSNFDPNQTGNIRLQLLDALEQSYAGWKKITEAKKLLLPGKSIDDYGLFVATPQGLVPVTGQTDIIVSSWSQCIVNREDIRILKQK